MLKKIMCLSLIIILVISSIGACSAKGHWEAPERKNFWTTSWHQYWSIPTENEWPVTFGHRGGLDAHQRLKDMDTGEVIYDGHGDGTIDRSHLYHTLLYTISWDGAPIRNEILIGFYAGGNLWIYSDYRSIWHEASWTNIYNNYWANENIGNVDGIATGVGTYYLPDDAWGGLP